MHNPLFWLAESIKWEKVVIIWLHRLAPLFLKCRAKCWSIIEYLLFLCNVKNIYSRYLEISTTHWSLRNIFSYVFTSWIFINTHKTLINFKSGYFGFLGIKPTRDLTHFLKIKFVIAGGWFYSYYNLQCIELDKGRKNVRKENSFMHKK